MIGIVASRLTESYYKPTIVLTKSNGLVTGSARSVKDFDVYDAIDEYSRQGRIAYVHIEGMGLPSAAPPLARARAPTIDFDPPPPSWD